MASGHVNRIKRPDTWLHRPTLQNVKKVLANPEPSTHGTERICRDFGVESAFGGKAEVGFRAPPMAAVVKVCGCRPHDGGAAHTGAGVRKPPREETAGGVARSCVRRYGEFDAGGLVPRCVA